MLGVPLTLPSHAHSEHRVSNPPKRTKRVLPIDNQDTDTCGDVNIFYEVRVKPAEEHHSLDNQLMYSKPEA